MPLPSPDDPLVLGPLLRFVGETCASVWVQTRDACEVAVRAFGREWSVPTFAVHGHHYALVILEDLEPGTLSTYDVAVDGELVWPRSEPGFEWLPPSHVATLRHTEPTRMAFGSCRTSVPHDAKGNASNGVDALRAYAHRLAKTPTDDWPHLVLFLGDQVYADDTSDEMREYIRSRRSIDEAPGQELKDYDEYAHLYWLAWTDPLNRWLLSTLPSAMIFDDHDIRDDWNTSVDWHREMNAKPWWHERLVGGLASYWVYQHLGNLSPDALAEDEVWQQIVAHSASAGEGELDLTTRLDALAERVDTYPETYRWSYARDLGESRLVVIDSRAARHLEPGRRSILDEAELTWLDEQLHGDVDHLFIGTSLPFLMAQGIHDLEAISEAMSNGAWGRLVARLGEKMRQLLDLEHWAAFQEGFAAVLDMVVQVARGERGRAPGTITFLSGDVHNSYVTEIDPVELGPGTSRVVQAVCSPIRNPLPRGVRMMTAVLAKGLDRPLQFLVSRSTRVPSAPFNWTVTHGPWFDNSLATLEVRGRGHAIRWEAGDVRDDALDAPDLRQVDLVVTY